MATGAQPQFLQNLPPQLQDRRVQIGIGAILLFVLLAAIGLGLNMFLNRGEDLGAFTMLLKDVEQSRAIEISSVLHEDGIETEMKYSDIGNRVEELSVREKQRQKALDILSHSELLNEDDFKLFDKTDWAASDYERRVKYMRAISGELSRTIGRLKGVRSAKAMVKVPQQKMFNSRYNDEQSSASITLDLEKGYKLTAANVSTIQNIVLGHVPELSRNKVAIVDTKGRTYSTITGGEDNMNGLSDFDFMNKLTTVNETIQGRVQMYLDNLVGPGRSTVVVSTSLTGSKMKKTSTRFLPGAIGTQEYSEEALGDAASASPYRGIEYFDKKPEEQPDPRLIKDMITTPEQAESMGVRELMERDLPSGSTEPKLGMKAHMGRSNGTQEKIYTCAPNDVDCKRNYRMHNFSIHSYPSYEQTTVERPPGDIDGVKVSVSIDAGILNESEYAIKRAIAAAAHPDISPESVEIIFRENPATTNKNKSNGLMGVFESEGGLPWWTWILIGIASIGAIGIAIVIGISSLNAQKYKTDGQIFQEVPYDGYAQPPTGGGQASYQSGRYTGGASPNTSMTDPFNNVPPPTVDGNVASYDDRPKPKRMENIKSTSQAVEDLPFDLEDEFAIDPQQKKSKDNDEFFIEDDEL